MSWIFALGIISFCIVSIAFRKLVLGMVALVACTSIGLISFFAYQDHVEKERVAEARLEMSKLPPCVGNDQVQAWFAAGGNCRPTTGPDAH